jgi:streptogramin lyase
LTPEGITAGPNNLIYIANTGKNNIISYDTVAGTVSLFSGVAGQSSGNTIDGALGVGKYFKPEGIRYNSSLSKLYVGETGGYNLRVVSTSNGTVTTLAGATGSSTRVGGTPLLSDGTVSVPSDVFNKPKGVVSDSKGYVYIVDKGNHCIRKYDPSTNTLSTFAGSRLGGDTGLGYVNATGTSAKFNAPYMITIDESDNLYVADAGNYAIRKITSAGVVTTIAGGNGKGRADGITATFYNPIGIYYKNKVLYVTDKGNASNTTSPDTDYSTIRKIVNF